MTLSTVSAATVITPVVIKTFLQHFHHKLDKEKRHDHNDPSNDIIFDQAFHIVKKFLDFCTYQDVESVQAFTNTHIPSPPWATVISVIIPLSKCNEAADQLIKWFGSTEEVVKTVGGERWWQVRGMDGVEAEWITMRSFLGNTALKRGKEPQKTIQEKMNGLQRVMLYIHGGAFYWGSINTHRYQILRMARKIGGRCFAVNYRKAPQYPFPCPVQDVLAAYLYLIRPPPGADHTAISSKNIVLAGDSAGGNLALTLLTLIRDLELPMPAGAVLISPWVDMTHSFPSVMANTATDIIPRYGFIHKPSALWPIPAIPESVVGRSAHPNHRPELLDRSSHSVAANTGEDISQLNLPDEGKAGKHHHPEKDPSPPCNIGQPTPVAMSDPDAEPMELRSQIQLYATNDQLTHPLVSPLLQGSLGGFCPLYILAGDNEVLRDEITYLAHRCSCPHKYPLRKGLLDASPRQKANVKRFRQPTKVHLQIYDGMPHVMTVYSFYSPVKHAYRAIAAFTRHVIDEPDSVTLVNPFPEPPTPREQGGDMDDDSDSEDEAPIERTKRPSHLSSLKESVQVAAHDMSRAVNKTVKQLSGESGKELEVPSKLTRRGSVFAEPENADRNLICERVDLMGNYRDLEPIKDIQCLQISNEEIGIIKDTPAKRYLEGQDKWDKAFRRRAESVVKRRQKYRVKADGMLRKAVSMGLLDDAGKPFARMDTFIGDDSISRRRWGPLDLEKEHPPPSAIAGRRDACDALALLKGTLMHSKPGTVVPNITQPAKRDAFEQLRAIVTEHEPVGPIQISASEQQRYPTLVSMHGLRIWAGIIRMFSKETRKKRRKSMKKGEKHEEEKPPVIIATLVPTEEPATMSSGSLPTPPFSSSSPGTST